MAESNTNRTHFSNLESDGTLTVDGNATITGTTTNTGAITHTGALTQTGAITCAGSLKVTDSTNGYNLKMYTVKLSDTPTTASVTGLSSGDVILGASAIRMSAGSSQLATLPTVTSASPPTVTISGAASNGILIVLATDANKW